MSTTVANQPTTSDNRRSLSLPSIWFLKVLHPHASVSAIGSLQFVSPGIANIIKLGEYPREDDEGSASPKDSFPQCLTRKFFVRKHSPVLGVVRVSH